MDDCPGTANCCGLMKIVRIERRREQGRGICISGVVINRESINKHSSENILKETTGT